MNIRIRKAIIDDKIQISDLVTSFRNEQNISFSYNEAIETAHNMIETCSGNENNVTFVA
ncbi:MAG: hypothetical protein GY756_11580 [bacterium]|nr:hypothetical protein [bacterium]